jgi:hypothetical protein
LPRLTDDLEALERDLARYPGTDENAHLNRRLLLREAFQSWGDGRYAEGLADGRRDVHDARRLARDAEETTARKADDG